jgi:hypothetical protein
MVLRTMRRDRRTRSRSFTGLRLPRPLPAGACRRSGTAVAGERGTAGRKRIPCSACRWQAQRKRESRDGAKMV